jgi:hypothetical protein
MICLDARTVLNTLVSSVPVRLEALPKERGIYALHDHAGQIRYIGCTPRGGNLRGRVFGRHVGGSEDRSHKFSRAYNCGRMWRAPRDRGADARTAKLLRRIFSRTYCRATFVVLPLPDREMLTLEAAVKALAAPKMDAWSKDRDFPPEDEPVKMVDALLASLSWTPGSLAALDRQATSAGASSV